MICWRKDRLPTPEFLDFACGSAGKESSCSVEDRGSIPGWEDTWVEKIHWRRDRLPTPVFLDFACGSAGKESSCNVGDWPGFNPWVGKILWRRARLLTPVFWPGEFQELYSPWGHKESDTTEQLFLLYHLSHQEMEKLDTKTNGAI